MGAVIQTGAKLVDVDLMEEDSENFPVGTPVIVIWGGFPEPTEEEPSPEAVWLVVAAKCPE